MASWKKVVVSGSAISQLNNDANFISSTGAGILSGSAQISADISGSLSAAAIVGLGANIVSASATGDAQGQVKHNGVNIDVNGMQTDDSPQFAGINVGHASDSTITRAAAGQIAIEGNNLLRANVDNVMSGSAQTVANLNNQDVDLGTGDISGVSGSFDYVGDKDTILTGSFRGDGSALTGITSVSEGAIQNLGIGIVSSSQGIVNFGADIVSSSAQTIANVAAGGAGIVSASAEGDAQGQIKLNGVNVDINAMGTGDSPTFTNLVLTGDLEVRGTQTTISSSTLDIGDNIIALNGTGAALGGMHVNDANGPASGSLLWDGTANKWIAGASGSEVTVALLEGQGLVSGSAAQVRTFINVEDGADVTDATNVTAAGALMDSELAEIATVKALTAAGISGSFVSASNALGSRIDNITSTITLAADEGSNDTYTTGETLTFSGDNSITTTVSDNEITISIANDVVSGSAQLAADISGSGNVRFEALNAATSSYALKDGQSLVSASVLSSPSQGTIRLATNGVNTDVDSGLQAADSPTFAGLTLTGAATGTNLTLSGDLKVNGTVTNINTSDLNIEDKFILLNSGSASGNSGIIAQNSSTNGVGSALYFDDTENRWSLDYAGANANTDAVTADARIAAVALSESDANYQKDGNIFVSSSGDVFIYVE